MKSNMKSNMTLPGFNKKRRRVARITSGNTNAALKLLKKLEEGKNKNGTKNIDSQQKTKMVGIDSSRNECEEGESIFKENWKGHKY